MPVNVNINASGVGASIMNAADPSAVSWIRVNADNTITYRTAAQTLSDLGAENALTFSTGLTRTVNTITIDNTVVTLTGAQALSNKTGLISQWTNDSGYLTSAVTAVTGSGNIASSGGATPNITFTGVLPTANGGTAVNIASAALVLGTASTTAGQLTLSNATNAFTQTLRGTNPAASIIYDLPTTAPTASQVLSASAPVAGVVTLSWATAAGGITVGTTTITSGTTTRIPFNDAGIYQEDADFTWTKATNYLGVTNGGITVNGGGTAAEGFLISGRTALGFPVAYITPTTNNTAMVYDLFPKGTAADVGGIGNCWFDLCSTDIVADGTNYECLRFAKSYNGAAKITTAKGGTGTVRGLLMMENGGLTTWGGNILMGNTTGASTATPYNISMGGTYSSTSGANPKINVIDGGGASSQLGFGASVGGVVAGQTQLDFIVPSNANYGWYYNGGLRLALQGSTGDLYIGNGVTNATASAGVISATGGSGSNNAGASLTKAGGKGTGTAAGGNNVEQTSVKVASGTTLQSLTDRHSIIGKYVDITESAATTFGTLALTTSGTIAGGVIVYTVEANDATDYQSLSGSAPYSVVNKAGTLTYVLGTDVQSSACSSGTLTGTLGLSASGTSLQFQMNAVSSLVQTTLRISFQVLNNMGVATISPA